MENELHHQTATFEKIWATLDRITEKQEKAALEMEELREKEKLEAERRREEYERRKKADERRQKEDERRQKEDERRQKEDERRQERADKRMKKLEGLFTTQWGALIESLVEGDLVPLLQKRNIAVTHTLTPVSGRHNGESYEFDILAANGEEVVLVEVKTTLRPEDVPHFLRKLDKFTVYVPAYHGKKIYGAVAYLKADKSVQVHAERQGLFVIRATGSSASIVNEKEFVPRVF